jgi:hypothetical protein
MESGPVPGVSRVESVPPPQHAVRAAPAATSPAPSFPYAAAPPGSSGWIRARTIRANQYLDERHQLSLEEFAPDHFAEFDVAFSVIVLEHVRDPFH